MKLYLWQEYDRKENGILMRNYAFVGPTLSTYYLTPEHYKLVGIYE